MYKILMLSPHNGLKPKNIPYTIHIVLSHTNQLLNQFTIGINKITKSFAIKMP